MKRLRFPRAGATATSAPSGPETGRGGARRRQRRRRLAAAVLISAGVLRWECLLRVCRCSSAPPEGGEARRALGGAGGPGTAAGAGVRPSRSGRRAGTQPAQLGLSAGRPTTAPTGPSPSGTLVRAGSTVTSPLQPVFRPPVPISGRMGLTPPGPDHDPTRSGTPPTPAPAVHTGSSSQHGKGNREVQAGSRSSGVW